MINKFIPKGKPRIHVGLSWECGIHKVLLDSFFFDEFREVDVFFDLYNHIKLLGILLPQLQQTPLTSNHQMGIAQNYHHRKWMVYHLVSDPTKNEYDFRILWFQIPMMVFTIFSYLGPQAKASAPIFQTTRWDAAIFGTECFHFSALFGLNDADSWGTNKYHPKKSKYK